MGIFKTLMNKFSPDESYININQSSYELNQRKLAFWVGLIAICLPVILLASRSFGVIARDSISHYFYVPWLGGVFIISLAFIGTFLVAYRGMSAWESGLATLAGWCVFGIALFPTNGLGFNNTETKVKLYSSLTPNADTYSVAIEHGNIASAFEQFTNSSTAHFTFAAIFFGFLAVYSLFVFTQPVEGVSKKGGTLTAVKTWRNRIYYVSGALIVFSIAIIAAHNFFGLWQYSWDEENLTFWFETLALVAFGFAWMVKGRFWGCALND